MPLHRPSSTRLRGPVPLHSVAKTLRLGLLATLLATVLSPTPAARAASIVVNTAADNITDDAFCTLREAIYAGNNAPVNANCGAGSGTDDTITFSAGSPLTITLATSLPNVVGGQGALTIDGGGNVTVSGNNSVRVLSVSSGATLSIQNLNVANGRVISGLGAGLNNAGVVTITNSLFSGHSTPSGGGAALYNLGSMAIISSTISNNSTTGGGGGLYNDFGGVNISNSTFFSNTAASGGGLWSNGPVTINSSTFLSNIAGSSGGGGGLYGESISLTITNTTFSGNSTGGNGGGLSSDQGTLTISGSTFSSNSANYFGGGLSFSRGTLTISGSTFSSNSANMGGGLRMWSSGSVNTINNSAFLNNTASGPYASGGGLISDSSVITIDNSEFLNNTASGFEASGGGLSTLARTATINDSTFSGNSSSLWGGGLYAYLADVTLSNSTVVSNSASIGGGLYTEGGTMTLNNGTVARNNAANGAGLSSDGPLTVVNSTFAGNTGSVALTVTVSSSSLVNTLLANNSGGNCAGPMGNDGNNLEDGSTCGWGSNNGSLSNTNPQLGVLTGSPAYFPLTLGSPAIDAGRNTGCPLTSQNGVARPADGDGNGAATCDIGSYEAPTGYRVYLPVLLK